MYREFFNLKENPFNITADPDFFYSSRRHAEAFSHLVYGIEQRKGILMVTGEIGTGKTTICRILLNRLGAKIKSAFILNPNFSDLQLLKIIIKDLGIQGHFRTKNDLVDALNTFLLYETSKGNNVVIVIDESQNLKVNQLEQIRLLSNLETEKQKLLQIILFGQPELEEKLKLPELRQLNQRIAVRYHILPLDKNEIKYYIAHRLKITDNSQKYSPKIKFTIQAVDAIYTFTKGTPRMINILCDRALLASYVSGQHIVNQKIIEACAKEIMPS